MPKRRNSQNRIPSFGDFSSFKPLEPEREKKLPGQTVDPLLPPEEQGTINRYLNYADTLINSSETNGSEAPADKESVRDISPLGSRRSTNKKVA
jgi:hypothetical protein